ncbi:MAG: hypothetical protein KHY83_08725 [Coriobacteriia bacterium]|nr:hypothetical protein [Coriobacteriia bacterium]MBS5478730.1 hypothetical protein [Coriobacteriia bacterium]
MSYLDDLKALFSDDPDSPEEDGGATVPALTTLETVRHQFEEARLPVVEHPNGLFTTNGERRGCGFATVEALVDEESGTCMFNIDTHLRVSPENVRPVKRMMRSINSALIQTGLSIGDGTVHFIPDEPIDIRGGGDIALAINRGLSTIHENAWRFTAIDAGIPAWKLD